MIKITELINKRSQEKVNFVENLKVTDLWVGKEHVQPDVVIEGCKAFIEGISKKIVLTLDKSTNTSAINSKDYPVIFKEAVNKISDYSNGFEVDFINRACSLISLHGNIRNKRGDISHGKSYPKEEYSTPLFAELVVQVTDAITVYMVESFYRIDLSIYLDIDYNDNPEYNDYLDAKYPDIGILYSKALYEQDYIQYEQVLLNYKDSLHIL